MLKNLLLQLTSALYAWSCDKFSKDVMQQNTCTESQLVCRDLFKYVRSKKRGSFWHTLYSKYTLILNKTYLLACSNQQLWCSHHMAKCWSCITNLLLTKQGLEGMNDLQYINMLSNTNDNQIQSNTHWACKKLMQTTITKTNDPMIITVYSRSSDRQQQPWATRSSFLKQICNECQPSFTSNRTLQQIVWKCDSVLKETVSEICDTSNL